MDRVLTENEQEKKAEGRAEVIQKLMEKQNMTAAQAMALLEIPEEEQEPILNHLSRLA